MTALQIFGMTLFIIMALIAVVSFGIAIYRARIFIKNDDPHLDYRKEFKLFIILGIVFVVSFVTMMIAIYPFSKIPAKPYEIVQGIFGSLFTGLTLYVGVMSFLIHYYKKDLPSKLDKWLFKMLIISIPLFLVFFMVTTNGYAAYWTYPLVNGLNFKEGFVSPTSAGSPNIAWYALFILFGALFVYFLCDHKFYQQYGKHGILESVLLVAFPGGIISARIGYVIGNWNVQTGGAGTSFAERVASGDILSIFAIWEGGLTILAGALGGIIIGVAWFLWRKKQYSIWLALDIIVPSILIAQAIGRWGNFFNCEVHGNQVSDVYFRWLPTFILENSRYSKSFGFASDGNIYVPLFLIESITNMLGYFLIVNLFGNKLRKHTELGDLAFAYPIWYGLTRVIMEPMRTTADVMGEKGYWSWFWSIFFVVIGILAIALNHFIRMLIRKHKKTYKVKKNSLKEGIISTSVVFAISLTMIVLGSVFLAMSKPSLELINFNKGNFGIVILIVGLALLSVFLITIPKIIDGLKLKKNTDEEI